MTGQIQNPAVLKTVGILYTWFYVNKNIEKYTVNIGILKKKRNKHREIKGEK